MAELLSSGVNPGDPEGEGGTRAGRARTRYPLQASHRRVRRVSKTRAIATPARITSDLHVDAPLRCRTVKRVAPSLVAKRGTRPGPGSAVAAGRGSLRRRHSRTLGPRRGAVPGAARHPGPPQP